MQYRNILLSTLLSGLLYAGGDIAPVEPAKPASADFWGQIGFSYEAHDEDGGPDWGDTANNQFSTTVILGVEKQLGYGFGFGAELAGWTDFGLDIADDPMIPNSVEGSGINFDSTSAEISQAYLTYAFGNTGIKAGRMALPDAVSPWAWSDRTAGVVDLSYEGVVVSNTDLSDTTLVGAWVKNAYISAHFGGVSLSDNGLFMAAIVNKSLPETTLSLSAYYVPDNELLLIADPALLSPEDTWAVWASAESSVGGFDTGVQFAYVDGDVPGWDATVGVAAKIGSSWGAFSAEAIVAYINDGDYSLMSAGSGLGTSAFWSDHEFDGDTVGEDQFVGILNLGYEIGIGTLNGSVAYWNYDDVTYEDAWAAVIGYEFEINGIEGLVEYAYTDRSLVGGGSEKDQRITIELFRSF